MKLTRLNLRPNFFRALPSTVVYSVVFYCADICSSDSAFAGCISRQNLHRNVIEFDRLVASRHKGAAQMSSGFAFQKYS